MPTPKKRVNKDGSITWVVRFRTPSGRSSSKPFVTQADAQWFADQITARGVPFALRSLRDLLDDDSDRDDSPALTQVFAEFIAWKRTRVRSSRTIEDYERQYADVIDPYLGSYPVASIAPEHVSGWVDDLADGRIVSPRTGNPYAPKTIAARHSLLYAVMEFAAGARCRYITANPCTGTTLPKRTRPAPKGLMPAEWQAIHAALRTDCADAADLAYFLLNTGWRWSEGAALTPAAVEDYGPGATMYVNMVQVLRRAAGGFMSAVPDGKAEASLRRISLDPDTAAVIRRRTIGKGINDPIFCSPDGDAWTYNEFRVRWRRAITVANLSRKPTVHWLRHTHVAWMAMSGAPLPELQARIGHASIQTTIGVYGRMISDVGGDTMAAFTRMRDAAPIAAAAPGGADHPRLTSPGNPDATPTGH